METWNMLLMIALMSVFVYVHARPRENWSPLKWWVSALILLAIFLGPVLAVYLVLLFL